MIRYNIHYATRQAMDISLHDYRSRVEYFFRLKPDFDPAGKNEFIAETK